MVRRADFDTFQVEGQKVLKSAPAKSSTDGGIDGGQSLGALQSRVGVRCAATAYAVSGGRQNAGLPSL